MSTSSGGGTSFGWHLDKRLNISHLLMTVTIVVGLFAWGSAIDRRVAILEERIAMLNNENARRDHETRLEAQRLREEFSAVRVEIRTLNNKFDRFLENRNNYTRP